MKFLTFIIALFITTSLFSEENTKKLFANFSTNLEESILDDIQKVITTIIKIYYSYIELNGIALEKLLNIMLDYHDSNYCLIKKYISIMNFTQHNMKTGKTEAFLVAHTKCFNPNHTGCDYYFNNSLGFSISSLGSYLTTETYYEKQSYSFRLDRFRLDELDSTNTNIKNK